MSTIPEGVLSFVVTFLLPPDTTEHRVTIIASDMTEALAKFRTHVPEATVKTALSNRYIIYT